MDNIRTTPANRPPILKTAEGFLFGSRWLLYPINAGLVLALIVYVYEFLIEDYELIAHASGLKAEEVMVMLLGLVDIAMVANLLVMIIQGSYQIFVRRLYISDPHSRPQWLDHVDSGILKVKVALSVTGITLIQVLKDFVNVAETPWEVIVHRMYLHGLCLVSAIVMAIIWRIMHPNAGTHSHNTHAGEDENEDEVTHTTPATQPLRSGHAAPAHAAAHTEFGHEHARS